MRRPGRPDGVHLLVLAARSPYRRAPLLILGVVCAFVSMATAVAADGQARIVVPENVHDFGSVEQGNVVMHAFRIENGGTTPLRIGHLKGTCACTVAASTERDVPPGESAEISVRLDTARLAGPTRKTVTVYTNDPETPVVGLTVTGRVESDLVLSSTALYIGRIRRGQPAGRDIMITTGRPGGKARVSWAEPTSPKLRTEIVDVPGGGQRLHVELDDGLPLGPFSEQVLLHTTSSQLPMVRIGVFGTIEGDVEVVPAQLTFGVTRGHAERGVHVRNAGTSPVAVTRASIPPELGTCALETIQPGREYRVTVRLRDGLAPGTVEGSLDIFTDHPVEGHLVVPLHGVVRPDRG